nr:AraC family transcriptional regulator [Elizabethkingia sp. ASV34]
MSYLAEECGYASHQVFINAFRKETGMTPVSYTHLRAHET